MSGHKDYGVFLPNAAGGWMISETAPYPPADYAYNRRVARLAEEAGLDFIMAMAKWRGFGGATDHWGQTLESMTMMAALAEATSTVKIWATVHANMQNPAFAAKVFTTLQQISGGRAGMNIVNGSYADEFQQMGIWDETMTHDQRYAMTEEWTQAVLRLWSEPSVTMHGDFFTLTDCESRPLPDPRPTIISAGRSERGRTFQARYADGAFLGAESLEGMRDLSRDVHERAATVGREVRTYSMLTVVQAETDAAAESLAAHYGEGLDREALSNMRRSWGWDAERALSWAQGAAADEAFQTPYVTGSAGTVAERVLEIVDTAELDGLMLIFPDYLEGLPRFGETVLPALRAATASDAVTS
ncbi:LLM class flavin-dependent oxidoreductase [Microbacterium aquimaris]|uniref:LLM class flavin-dependent oxidoreductase n=1 Tax=Microbacterium aquimaris TaxID=459816 RepID=A0ABU5N4Y8_9MICO|nr:LLM class flavin-dependent oxidoreductase [Microbacterium aquimaris]MDZ8161159.1 LLM class flavin-dependent oxidoreductase [Microbacterium aquimaris]